MCLIELKLSTPQFKNVKQLERKIIVANNSILTQNDGAIQYIIRLNLFCLNRARKIR